MRVEHVRLLLEYRADPNLATNGGSTPLMEAALKSQMEIMRLLIESAVLVNTMDKHGWTALLKAAYLGHKLRCCRIRNYYQKMTTKIRFHVEK